MALCNLFLGFKMEIIFRFVEQLEERTRKVQAFAWKWDQLRRLGESRAIRLTSLLPVLAFLLSYIQPLETIVNGAIYLSVNLLNPNVLMFFYGLISFAVGMLIYVLFVPYQVGKYGDDVEYFNAEKDAWWLGEFEPISHRIPNDSPHAVRYKKSGDFGIEVDNKTEVIRKYYRYLSETQPLARLLISILFLCGFVLTTLPIIFRIAHITSYLIFS